VEVRRDAPAPGGCKQENPGNTGRPSHSIGPMADIVVRRRFATCLDSLEGWWDLRPIKGTSAPGCRRSAPPIAANDGWRSYALSVLCAHPIFDDPDAGATRTATYGRRSTFSFRESRPRRGHVRYSRSSRNEVRGLGAARPNATAGPRHRTDRTGQSAHVDGQEGRPLRRHGPVGSLRPRPGHVWTDGRADVPLLDPGRRQSVDTRSAGADRRHRSLHHVRRLAATSRQPRTAPSPRPSRDGPEEDSSTPIRTEKWPT
jgi:hypothetical protein